MRNQEGKIELQKLALSLRSCIKLTCTTYFLSSTRTTLWNLFFNFTLKNIKGAPLILFGILFHILVAMFAMDSIPKCVEWMFDLARELPHLNS